MIRTLKNILSDIEDFCDAHLQIKEFGNGKVSNITTKDHNFVMLWLQPTGSIITGHMMSIFFDMYIIDLVKQDLSNLDDVLSDTLLIGYDVVTKFWSDEETYGWTLNENGVKGEFFDAKFDDFCAGNVFNIEVQLSSRLNSCIIPE